jgi:hypothetical protein
VSLLAGGLCACRYAGRNKTALCSASGRSAKADRSRACRPLNGCACQARGARETSCTYAYSLGFAHDREA